jgi:hypothetical protein
MTFSLNREKKCIPILAKKTIPKKPSGKEEIGRR